MLTPLARPTQRRAELDILRTSLIGQHGLPESE
jgi:hypothetical protein